MKKIFIFLLIIIPGFSFSQSLYEKYFEDKTMRFDFLLGGNNKEVKVFPQQVKQENTWAGSKVHLKDFPDFGSYRFRIYDFLTDSLLFSKGFCTLFQEWQTTAEAKTTNRTFYQALIFPYPKAKVRLEIEARQWEGSFKTIFETEIDPVNYFIIKELPLKFKTFDILENGKPSVKADLLILAEGYTKNEMVKFEKDARRVTDYLFSEEPFKSEKDKFNVKAVFTESVDSGTDIPGENIFRNTVFNSTFYTFNLDRYLTTSDLKSIHDAAANVPYDFIYVLVNTERYGGGGFYNFVSVCTSDNKLTKQVFTHEFGHCFAGLGDEYYNSTVAYEDFYNLKIEPWEPNLTTLIDFESKWKNLLSVSVPVPTPRTTAFKNETGVFEGGGYLSKGIYSPAIDCRMKSNQADGFCKVCQQAIKKTIQLYSE